MGGEPLDIDNLKLTYLLVMAVKRRYPNKKIYIWTGHYYIFLQTINNFYLQEILKTVDYLIDGKYIESQRDITLPMRGSHNQDIWNLKTGEKENDKFR